MLPVELTSTQPLKFKFEEATDASSIDATRLGNAAAWKKNLTVEEYVTRENVLSKSTMVDSGNNMHVYLLKHPESDELMCLMEIVVRPAWIFKWQDGEVKQMQVNCGCIGAVYTHAKFRSRGLAADMINHAVEIAKKSVIGADGFTFLYSEVGDYYNRCGFTSCNVPIFCLDIDKKHVPSASKPEIPDKTMFVKSFGDNEDLANKLRVRQIEFGQFAPYIDQYRENLQTQLIEKVEQDKKTRACAVPTEAIIEWFHFRAKYLSNILFYNDKQIDFNSCDRSEVKLHFSELHPKIFGLGLQDANENNVGMIVWTYGWNEGENGSFTSTVQIIKLFAVNDSDSLALIDATVEYHQSISSKQKPLFTPGTIEIWTSDLSEAVITLLSQSYQTSTKYENPSRSAIMMHNPDENQQLQSGDLLWEDNSKLHWF